MQRTGSRRLGEALDALLRRKQVSIAHIMRVAHLSRNTITSLRRGTTHQPSPDTLRRIALAFATDALSAEVDMIEMHDVNAVLNDAYGYATPTAQEAKTLLDLAVFHHFKSPARVRASLALLRAIEDLPTADIERLVEEARRRA